MAETQVFTWWHGRGTCPEAFNVGAHTRDGTIAAALDDYDGEPFTICEAHQDAKFNFDIFDACEVRERFEEANEECWGEDGMEWSTDAGLIDVLEAALRGWFYKNKPCRSWALQEMRNVEEFSEAEIADLALEFATPDPRAC